jgi:asparagine synthase (glutamine-hydrolysing)
VPSCIETFSTRAVKMRPLLADDFRAKYGPREGSCGILDDVDIQGQLKGWDRLHQSLYLWSKIVMRSYILTVLGHRMEMAHSIEGRVPFLAHKLVEAIVSQPVNQKVRGMTEKFVLRGRSKTSSPIRFTAGRSTPS